MGVNLTKIPQFTKTLGELDTVVNDFERMQLAPKTWKRLRPVIDAQRAKLKRQAAADEIHRIRIFGARRD